MLSLEHPQYGVVSSANAVASQAGLDMLQAGGNAVDAAVATAAALNVVDPGMTGIGGDAFMLVSWSDSDDVVALNASGRAPAAATIERYRELGHTTMPLKGALSVTVPGAAKGWQALHDRYGELPWASVLAPAIALAREGCEVAPAVSVYIGVAKALLRDHPFGRDTYLTADGNPLMPGDTLVQADLANSLQQLADDGADALYTGELGRRFAAALAEQGGLMTPDDLAAHTVDWTTPLATDYRGYEVLVMPPNSHGLTLLVMLNILEPLDIAGMGAVERLHWQIEAKKQAFAVRESYIGDPEHLPVDPAELLTPEYAEALRARIDPARASAPQTPPALAHERSHTTYLCAADAQGNRVSFINSLFEEFGSGVVAGDTGIVCQNRGASFSLDPAHVNALTPGRRPMHTLIPPMVRRDGKVRWTFGCIGGDQQPQGLLQILQHLIDDGNDIEGAVKAPRFRSYDGNQVAIERKLEPLQPDLEARGHAFCEGDFFGACQMIEDGPNGELNAYSDPRIGGAARGA